MKNILVLVWLFILLLSVNRSLSTKITGYLCRNHETVHPRNKLVCDNVVETDSRYHSCDVEQFAFGNSRTHTFLDTGDCRGAALDPKIPEMFPNLYEYNISHHGIETLTPDDLRLENLLFFHATHNKLKFIPAGLFKYTPKMFTIDLDFNNITAIENGAFSEVSWETIIRLRNNPIRRIDGKIFLPIHFRNTYLDITWDNVEEFDISNMNGQFDMEYNDRVDGFAFGKLDIQNGLRHLYRTEFYAKNRFEHLKVFNASGTCVKNIIDLVKFFGPSIEVLDVSSNSIGQLNGSVFDRFDNLQILNLSNTNLTAIDFNNFHNRASLKVLDLSYNNLNGIDFAASVGAFENLETLNLKGNKVRDLPSIFPKLSSLEISFQIVSHDNQLKKSLTQIHRDGN